MTEFPLRIALPHDQWAELRDPEEVSERQRRRVRKAQQRVSLHSEEVGRAQQLAASGVVHSDGTVAPEAAAEVLAATKGIIESGVLDDVDDAVDMALAALVARWSFDTPVSAETVADLPGGAYKALRDAAQPLIGQMNPDFDPSPDPESPTKPSSD